MTTIELLIILAVILFLPFLIRRVEENIEIFLFIASCIGLTITSQWSARLLTEALTEPVKITLAVFIAGLLFKFLQKPLAHSVNRMADAFGMKTFAFFAITALGFLSSVITAIVSALILVEIVAHLTLDRKNEIRLVILACFSIGLGAVLTPIGEPLSTITIAKLKGEPHHAGFFFLLNHMWLYIVPGIAAFGMLGAILMPVKRARAHGLKEDREENLKDIVLRAVKVYLFIMALIFLGRVFKPLVDIYMVKMTHGKLYWFNMISAVVDNATLAAAEIGPGMSMAQIKSAILGLLIAGGMLIPGNIPNIIASAKLKIKSSEWAVFGLPLGLIAMMIYFFLLGHA